MKLQKRMPKDAKPSKRLTSDKFLLTILLLDVFTMYWLLNFDKVVNLVSWFLGK